MIYDLIPFELLTRRRQRRTKQWEPEPLYLEEHIRDEDKSPVDRNKDLPIRRVVIIDI
jgi:hypothetical protein